MIEKWLIFAIAAMILLAGFQTLFKFSSGKIDYISGILIFQGVAFAVTVGIYLFARNTVPQVFTMNGAYLMILGGVVIAFVNIFIFRALELGSLNLVVPIINSSIVLVALLSVLFLGETITFKSSIGTLLILGGIVLVAS